MMPPELSEILDAEQSPEELFTALMGAIAEFLHCDRCFLYLRDPETRLGRVPFCWTRHADVPVVYDEDWKLEPENLGDDDPMFAAALDCKPSIFVEDVTTESPDILNAEFERENFGHRALIHGHLCQNHQLWGVLQPCMMNEPRHWTIEEQAIFVQIIERVTAITVTYVEQNKKSPIRTR